jgi:hypothetical protein
LLFIAPNGSVCADKLILLDWPITYFGMFFDDVLGDTIAASGKNAAHFIFIDRANAVVGERIGRISL